MGDENNRKYLSKEGLILFVNTIKDWLFTKVDKVPGMGLSSNDYTTAEKEKLSDIDSGAQVNVIESITVNDVAQTVSSDKSVDITVPTAVSDLDNDANYATTDEVAAGLAEKQDTLDYGTPTGDDVGKALVPKTVENGVITSWEFDEAGLVDDVQINGTSIVDQNGVAEIPIASASIQGVMRVDPSHGANVTSGSLRINGSSGYTKDGTASNRYIMPSIQHEATFYGLSKAAGVDLKNETVTVGTYPETSKSAIKTMLGVEDPVDVQINGTSIVDNGVANIPYATSQVPGVVMVGSGLGVNANNRITVTPASANEIKASSTTTNNPIIPARQDASTFYGLAKAAGDTTQSQSSNAVGQYTDGAKSAIKSMLGFATQSDITSAISQITQIEFAVVQSLPVTGTTGTIYLIQHQHGDSDIYDEYIWIASSSSYEKIGNTDIDLTDYLQKSAVVSESDIDDIVAQVYAPTVGEEAVYLNKERLSYFWGEAKDYIDDGLATKMPNVTFGEEVVLMDTTEFTFTKDGDNPWYIAEFPYPNWSAHINKRFTVTVDGVDYVAFWDKSFYVTKDSNKSAYGNIAIGNKYFLGYPNNNAYPFCIHFGGYTENGKQYEFSEIATYFNESSNVVTHTIKVTVATMNVEYVPEHYYKINPNIIRKGSGSQSALIGNGAFDAQGEYSVAYGVASRATGTGSFAGGLGTVASGGGSFSIGSNTIASGAYGSSFGMFSEASGPASHAEGRYTVASGGRAHTEGTGSTASGFDSHAEGTATIANHKNQHVFGKYNIADPSVAGVSELGNYVEIVGNGADSSNRSNARTLDWSGNEILSGKLTVGTAPTNSMDVATKGYVDTTIGSATSGLITDVQVNGSSVVNNGVANVPVAGVESYGVIRIPTNYAYGIGIYNGYLAIATANSAVIKAGDDYNKTPSVARQHEATFYGLSKAAGVDMADSNNAIGFYTAQAKTAIQTMLGVPSADSVVSDVQVNGTSVTSNGVANIPIANGTNFGVVNINPAFGVGILNGYLMINSAISSDVKAGNNSTKAVSAYIQHESVFYGLSKAAGVNLKNEEVTVGTYPAASKTAIQTMLGVPSVDAVVTDVQVNGTSVVSNGVAEIPKASDSVLGTVRTGGGITVDGSGVLMIVRASNDEAKAGTQTLKPITPKTQHASTFYGLAKAAGDTTQSASSNAVGSYTDEAKAAIQSMLDVAPSAADMSDRIAKGVDSNGNIVQGAIKIGAINDVVIQSDGNNYNYSANQATGLFSYANGIQTTASGYYSTAYGINNVASGTGSFVAGGNNTASGVQSVAFGSGNTVSGQQAIAFGQNAQATGALSFATGIVTSATGILSQAHGMGTIANSYAQHVFGAYNITDPFPSTGVTHGTYIEIVGNGTSGNARSNARTLDWNGNEVLAGKLAVGVGPTADMDVATKLYVDTQIGTCVSDVEINGTSIVSNGVANIPMASSSAFGAVKINASSYGIGINPSDGCIYIGGATDAAIKEGTATYRVIFPQKQHQAVFYGLAKASGDTTQSASSNAVGSYTDSAKASIKSMLGIGDRLSDIEVEVTGTTPTITANSSTRYICGEVTEVTFTPPASGTTELIFESGSTVPTLTLPSSVLMPEWFIIEPNRIYQISIENNRYGAVASWPVA